MTPGMLTKLNNLRNKQRVIFILATNYAYRIDPAIRRTGRIDEKYLLLPPDERAREQMLRKFLKEKFKDGPPSLQKVGKREIVQLQRVAGINGSKCGADDSSTLQAAWRCFGELRNCC
jgi:SpoVK/Ycf46/Vps4 family AAA+-type ATPase